MFNLFKMERKGLGLRDLAPAAMIIVAAGISLAVGAKVTATVATGQTAGTAAALALQQGKAPRELKVERVQEALQAQGMDLEL